MNSRDSSGWVRKLLLSRWTYRIARGVIALIFIFAGTTKLIQPGKFALTVSSYDFVPDFMIIPLALGLPVIELLAGIALLFDIRGSLTVILCLLLMFCGVLGYAMANNLEIDCGCFSLEEIKGMNSIRIAMIKDFILIVTIFYLYAARRLRAGTGNDPAAPTVNTL